MTLSATRQIILILSLAASAAVVHAQDFALERLEESPRHHEWAKIEADGRTVHSFVAYPEEDAPTLSVVVIHENRGLTDWVRSFADQLAAEGYVAVAPDLLSEFDDEHERTRDFESSDAARDAIYRLDPEQITTSLLAVREYASGLPASNGKTVVMGFCWGGSQTFRFVTNSQDVEAGLVFYGSPPEDGYERITAPVYGFYGENDERINATIPATKKKMAEYGNAYDVVIYDGASHAFMRQGDDPEGSEANKAARDAAWERLRAILAGL